MNVSLLSVAENSIRPLICIYFLHCLETTFSHELESQVAAGCLLMECFLQVHSTKARLAEISPH